MMMENNFAYKVSVKNGAGWRPYTSLRILISVGQPYHNGPKFKALIDWINRDPSISHVQFCVNDELQRWNLIANGWESEQARKETAQFGRQWINEHAPYIRQIEHATVEVVQWRKWLDDPLYHETKEQLNCLLKEKQGDELKELIAADSLAILERRKKKFAVSDEQRFLSCSQSFIEEELAALAVQHTKAVMADVYPGSMLKSAEWFNNPSCELPTALKALQSRYFCRIDFSRVHVYERTLNVLNGLGLHVPPNPMKGHRVRLRA